MDTLNKSKVKRKSSGNEEETASKKSKSQSSCEVTKGKSSKTHRSAPSNEKKAHVEKVKKDATDKTQKKPKASQGSTPKSKDSGKEKMKDDSPNPAAVKKNEKGQLVFKDCPEFRPNMTPKEVLQAGSFGGTYFRPIYSSVTKQNYKDEVWKELPEDWLKGLNISKQVASPTYRNAVNTYDVKCGGSLEMWESSGWIMAQDPYGWFQWYCRFYQGRRTKDDERQISRWAKCAGVKGRWRNNLITKVVRSGCGYDNRTVSPVVRQTLQHWGYRLSQEDYKEGAKRVKPK